LDQIEAACSGEKPRDPVTQDERDLDEKLMNSIEEQIQISSSGKDDFRNEILRAVGTAARKDKTFDYTQHAQLREAIQKKLFEERKNVIRMTVSTRNPDPDELKRINEVVARMVDQQGYSTGAANALLKYASSQLFDK
jgi:serine protein kinase